MSEGLSLQEATEAFCQGYTRTRQLSKPTDLVRTDSLWLFKDASQVKDQRKAAAVTLSMSPEPVIEDLKGLGVKEAFLSVILPKPMDEVKRAYNAVGYRLIGTEPFFVRPLVSDVQTRGWHCIRQVTTEQEIEAVAKAKRRRPQVVRAASQEPCRLYACWEGERALGWVTSVPATPGCRWVSDLYVGRPWRRQGIGRELMAALLRDDRLNGERHSVLLASHTGALVYSQLGYEQIGLLYLFAYRPKG